LQSPHKKESPMIPSLLEWGQQWWHWPMCACYESTKQCQHVDDKIKEKVIKEHGLTPTKYETLHLSQCT
jgi:hypothetical protein